MPRYGIALHKVRQNFPLSWLRHDPVIPGCKYPPGKNVENIFKEIEFEKRLLEISREARIERQKNGSS